MLSEASLQRIHASPGWRAHRIEIIDLPEGRVVVKGQRPARGAARFWLMAALAQMARNPVLRPVPAPGGRQAQEIEVQRLYALAAAGVRVPALLYQGDDFLVLEFVAGTPVETLRRSETAIAMQAFERALCSLAEVHQRGQYLSQAFARNLIDTASGLVFLDFEDDPLTVMALPDAQARDWLAFLLSTVWMANIPRPVLWRSWHGVQERLPRAVQSRIQDATQRLAWMRHLPSQRKPWGRDVVALQALASFLVQSQRTLT